MKFGKSFCITSSCAFIGKAYVSRKVEQLSASDAAGSARYGRIGTVRGCPKEVIELYL